MVSVISEHHFWLNISRFWWLNLSDFSGAIHADATGSVRTPYSAGSGQTYMAFAFGMAAYKINIKAIDAKHNKSMREVYGLKASESH